MLNEIITHETESWTYIIKSENSLCCMVTQVTGVSDFSDFKRFVFWLACKLITPANQKQPLNCDLNKRFTAIFQKPSWQFISLACIALFQQRKI
jgi:hypothetical protein